MIRESPTFGLTSYVMKNFLLLITLVSGVQYALAQTYYSYDNGGSVGWSSTDPDDVGITSTSAPGESDDIVITDAIAVTFSTPWNLGQGGSASITIRDGADLTVSGLLEVTNGSTLTVEGGGLITTNALLVRGGTPGGTLTVSSGGTFTVNGNFTNNNNSDGVSIDGSMSVGGNLDNGNNSDIIGNGTLTVDGTVTNDGTIGGMTGTSAFGTLSSTLPVELISFTSENFSHGTVLNWVTATEINNDYFLVQRSENGSDFYEIGEVDGHGTVTETKVYYFVDHLPLAQVEYYRLKQVDFDGAYEIHQTIVVSSDRLARSVRMDIFPNPASEKISLKSVRPLEYKELVLVDISGKEVANLKNSLEGSGLVFETSLPQLDRGLYHVQYTTSDGSKGATKLFIE